MDVYLFLVLRYESGSSQPSLEAVKKIAHTLRVTTDSRIFEEDKLAADAQRICNIKKEG
jgi:transcriptional regulator with XRE-family HTH domain